MDTNKQNALADIEAMDMLKDELYESKMMTNDDTRDIAIRCVDRLVLGGMSRIVWTLMIPQNLVYKTLFTKK